MQNKRCKLVDALLVRTTSWLAVRPVQHVAIWHAFVPQGQQRHERQAAKSSVTASYINNAIDIERLSAISASSYEIFATTTAHERRSWCTSAEGSQACGLR